jgi:hypothetical protein
MEAEVQVKERPILFSTPMVKAILAGRKTVTRRVIQTPPGAYGFYVAKNNKGEITGLYAHDENERTEKPDGSEWKIKCPYNTDVLWVRETWTDEVNGKENWYSFFKADFPMTWKDDYGVENTMQVDDLKWKPSIFMPKHICRLRLKIKSIRVERLHDITEEDAKREGAPMYVPGHGLLTQDELNSDPGYANFINYRMGFEHLWSEINGKESWEANPWVWVITFEKL